MNQVCYSCFDDDLLRRVGLLNRLLIHLHQHADAGHDRIVPHLFGRWELYGPRDVQTPLRLSGEHRPTHLACPATDVALTASYEMCHCAATFQSYRRNTLCQQ